MYYPESEGQLQILTEGIWQKLYTFKMNCQTCVHPDVPKSDKYWKHLLQWANICECSKVATLSRHHTHCIKMVVKRPLHISICTLL